MLSKPSFKYQLSLLFYKQTYKSRCPVRRLSSTAKLSASDVEDGCDRRNIHKINQTNHKEKGPIYYENLGPDAKIIYIADPKCCAKIFRNGTYFLFYMLYHKKDAILFSQQVIK